MDSLLGMCCQNGWGTESNAELAFSSFKQSAEQGYVDAYSVLAHCYRDAIDTDKNYDLAFHWITKAVEETNIDPEEYLFLGDLYANGLGVQKNDKLAFKWYEKAAESNVAEAEYRLGNYYSHGKIVEQDNYSALHCYELAANRGHALAKNETGKLYFGLGRFLIFGKDKVTDHDTNAFECLNKAVEYGYLKTYEDLSEAYCLTDFNESYTTAIDWYEQAVKQGVKEAESGLYKVCSRYASYYAIGLGVEKDNIKANHLMVKAMNSGSEEGVFLKHTLLFRQIESDITTGKDISDDLKESLFNYFKHAMETNQNNDLTLQANTYLGNCYANGIGTEKNTDLANYHLQKGGSPKEKGWNLLALPPESQLAKESVAEILKTHFSNKNLQFAEEFLKQTFKEAKGTDIGFKNVSYMAIEQAQLLEKKNQELENSQKELEDMMSMFAHKFRSPLDAIIYNTSHENSQKLYIEAAQSMRGLLDIFSLISTDDKILTQRIMKDSQGECCLIDLFSNNLNMILLHFLSVSSTEKIRQHYINYAKTHKLCDADLSLKVWNEEYFELEQSLQSEWEQSYSSLLAQPASLEQRLQWLEEHFFKLELQGFSANPVKFQKYATTESFLTIILNEILVNVFKYYASDSKQAVTLTWENSAEYQILSCNNPSTRFSRSRIKDSSKGHTFLSALAHKTGCEFNKPELQDDFIVEFKVPNQLLMTQ